MDRLDALLGNFFLLARSLVLFFWADMYPEVVESLVRDGPKVIAERMDDVLFYILGW